MTCNVGRTEAVLRTLLGSIVLFLGYYFNSWWGLVGILPITTALIGWCPVSALLHINTCKQIS